jgi:hypothetical protein
MDNRKHKMIGAMLAAWVMLVFAGCPNEGEGENTPPDGDQNLCYYVSSFGDDDINDGLTEDFPFRTLSKAYARAATDSARKTVVVLSSLESADAFILPVPANGPVVIKGKGAGITITRNAGVDGSVVEITTGVKIRFENITVNGKVDEFVYHRALSITGEGTEVTLGKGTVITGKSTRANYLDGGTGIFVGGGAWLVMGEGSAVTGCEGSSSSVYGFGEFSNTPVFRSVLAINEGADISNNKSSGSGGGVSLLYGGIGIMTGGTIRNNTTSSYGGGVLLEYGTFSMYSGEISGNTAGTNGGGVYNIIGTFSMYNGEISGNTAGTSGGGIYNDSTFTMYGGVIYGNEATNGDLKNTAVNDGAALYGVVTKNGVALSTTSSTITAP